MYLCKNKISLSDRPIDSSAPAGFDFQMFCRCADVGEKKRKEEKKNICYLRWDYDGDAMNFERAAALLAISGAAKETQPPNSAAARTIKTNNRYID